MIATGGLDKLINIWNLDSSVKLRTFKNHSDQVLGLAFSKGQQLLLSVGADATLRIWKITENK